MFGFPSLVGRDRSLPLRHARLLRHGQAPPPPRRQPGATRSERAASHGHGPRGHTPPGAGAPAGSPVPESARPHRLGQRDAVGGARLDVLAVGRLTRPAGEKRLLLWDRRAPGYDPSSAKVCFH